MSQMVILARSVTANGRFLTEEAAPVLFEDQRVMSFTFRVTSVRDSNPAWRDLRSGIQSIACCRAVLFNVCKNYTGTTSGSA